jgi:type VI secretion system protein ImpA
MSAAFDAVAGIDAPPVSALRELLEEISRSIAHFAADKLAVANYSSGSEDIAADDPADVGEAGARATGEATVVVRKIEGYQSREEALAELSRIASYFRKTEPHSPMSYTLDDAVRRARMSLPELLLELVEDPSHLQRILLAAGIKPPEQSQGY